MKKHIALIIIATILMPAIANSAVYFITKPDGKYQGATERPCMLDGYTLTGECSNNKTPYNFCPSDSKYYRLCKCNDTIYQFDDANCTNGKSLSGEKCDGKYETCECNLTTHPYNRDNCPAPKILAGNQCDNNYQFCSCPGEYNQTCSSPLVGVDAKDCNGKYTKCKCPSSYVKCDYGGTGASCTDSDGEKFTSCKSQSCTENGYIEKIPLNTTCTAISLGNKTCYTDCKCKVNYADLDNYWCNSALRCLFIQYYFGENCNE